MSFEDNILLKLRRQFSGQEKYRLFLQQLDRLETELAAERKLNTELMKANQTVKELQEQLSEYTETRPKTCVTLKKHEKLRKEKDKYLALYIELYHKFVKPNSSPQIKTE